MTFLELYSFAACAAWIAVYFVIAVALKKIPFIDDYSSEEPPAWPKLSVLIAACNEEDTIEAALEKLLAQGYPDLEVIAVNDRSTDSTGEILDKMASSSWMLRVIHVESLPQGWLGKVHALKVAAEKAGGEWLLFTDADVHFASGVLKKGVEFALSHGADHLAIAPGMNTKSFPLEVVVNAFAGMFMLFTGAGRPQLKDKGKAVGVGAFNLVRRSSLDNTEGLEWLKMEVADDVGLALMLKRSGASSSFAVSKKDVSLIWYETVGQMFKGLEKNIFGATAGYSYIRASLLFILAVAFACGPFVPFIYASSIYAKAAALAAYSSLLLSAFIRRKRFGGGIFPDLFIPLGQVIIAIMLLRAALLCFIRGGIVWRGTLYRTEDLKKGQRVLL